MLPMDIKPVTRGNDVVLTLKPCHQTSPVPYLNENRSTLCFCNAIRFMARQIKLKCCCCCCVYNSCIVFITGSEQL